MSFLSEIIPTKEELVLNLDKLHTTELGIKRIKRNLCLNLDDVVIWCKQQIIKPNSDAVRKGKNFYIDIDSYKITVNAHSYTIITAHRKNMKFSLTACSG